MHELAQVNVAVMGASLDSPQMAGFVETFDPIMRLAEASPGFVWRLHAETGHVVLPPRADHDGAGLAVNVSVWTDYRSLHAFTYRSQHGAIVRRRRRWFRPTRQPSTALWWVPAGHQPTVEQALARLEYLRTHGPSPRAFSLLQQYNSRGSPLYRRNR